jgi:hypothetical protein
LCNRSLWRLAYPVCPLGIVPNQSSQDTRSDDLTNDPAQVDVGGEVLSEMDRHDIGGVGDRHGLEGTPGELSSDGK